MQAFQECDRFQHRWTNFHLSSSVIEVSPGEQKLRFNHTVGPLEVQVALPPRGRGVHGIIIGDPCVSSRYFPNLCNSGWDVMNRLPAILNLINSVDQLDFVVILGDAFYDVLGDLSSDFFRRLSKRTQQVLMMSVPGNHDFWMYTPKAPLPQDQLGFGFAQWYGQDTAATADSMGSLSKHWGPLLRSQRAPQPAQEHAGLLGAESFFFYHMIGDIGFLGYSGAHTWESQEHLFQEACSYFGQELPSQVYLLGHWSEADMGCQTGMDVPSLYAYLRDGLCSGVGQQMRYFMGHDHCNTPAPDGRGYLVGGGGARPSCGSWGFAYTDTRDSTQSSPSTRKSPSHFIGKFDIETPRGDHFWGLQTCIVEHRSLRACVPEYGEVWLNETTADADPWSVLGLMAE